MQAAIKESMKCQRVNDFKILHLKKQARHNSGNESNKVHCDPETTVAANELVGKAEAWWKRDNRCVAVISRQHFSMIVALKTRRR